MLKFNIFVSVTDKFYCRTFNLWFVFKQYREIVAALKFGGFSIRLFCSMYLFVYSVSVLTGSNGRDRTPLAAAARLGEWDRLTDPRFVASFPVLQRMGWLCRTVVVLASSLCRKGEGFKLGCLYGGWWLDEVSWQWTAFWQRRGDTHRDWVPVPGKEHGEGVRKMKHEEVPSSVKSCTGS